MIMKQKQLKQLEKLLDEFGTENGYVFDNDINIYNLIQIVRDEIDEPISNDLDMKQLVDIRADGEVIGEKLEDNSILVEYCGEYYQIIMVDDMIIGGHRVEVDKLEENSELLNIILERESNNLNDANQFEEQ